MTNKIEKIEKKLGLFFLGPKAEQRTLLKEVIDLVLNDFIFWRRNFHPKDPPAIAYRDLTSEEGTRFKERFMEELFALTADLKLDIPLFSPRYMAHMTGELSLPGLIAHLTTSLYNPNNIGGETAPVTIKFEKEVRLMLGQMLELDGEKIFGNFTSGGTMANYQSLYYHQLGRSLPLSLAMAFKQYPELRPPHFPHQLTELLAMPIDQGINHWKTSQLGQDQLRPYLLSELGHVHFWKLAQDFFKAPGLRPILILPQTAHYSWYRAASLLGIGKSQIKIISCHQQLECDLKILKETIQQCYRDNELIIQMVAIFGSTEFGHFDPMAEISELAALPKSYFPIHVDAAYGGHFPAMFRPGHDHPELAEAAKHKHPQLFASSMALKKCDSITIDPHKMGLIPYSAGFFLTTHPELRFLVAEKADYLFHSPQREDFNFGQYILEGSRPGTQVAATYFSYKVIPLNSDGYGALFLKWCEIGEQFYHLLEKYSEHDLSFIALHRPQSNILCFIVRPQSVTSASKLSKLSDHLYHQLLPSGVKSVQYYDYFISKTQMKKTLMAPEIAAIIQWDQDSITTLRVVFMNIWSDHPVAGAPSALEGLLLKLKSQTKKVPTDFWD